MKCYSYAIFAYNLKGCGCTYMGVAPDHCNITATSSPGVIVSKGTNISFKLGNAGVSTGTEGAWLTGGDMVIIEVG